MSERGTSLVEGLGAGLIRFLEAAVLTSVIPCNMRTPRKKHFRHRSSLALFCFGAAVALAVPAHADLISDGGFEAAAVNDYSPGAIGDGWTVLSGTIGIFDTGSGFGAAHGGVNYADLDVSSTVNSLTQAVATTVGQNYTVSFWLGDDVGGDPVTVSFGATTLFNANTPVGLGLAADNYQWQLHSYTVAATSASSSLTFTSNYTFPGPGVGAVIDDVNVVAASSPVPEPTWTAVMAVLVGLGIAGARGRRAVRG
jgi:hypothetical protein